MNWFKKKLKKVEKEFEVGKTIIELKFDDEILMNRTVYGFVNQLCDSGAKEYINSSVQVAIDEISSYYYEVVTDDALNPTESHRGKVVHAKILETTEYKRKFAIYEVVDIDEEK